MRKSGPLLAALSTLMLLQAAPALAHAERIKSVPDEGARLKSPPQKIRINFTEPPIADALSFVVTDGCDRDLVQDLTVQNFEIEAVLEAGQPGRWNVETRVVSAVDGHATSDSWTFSVAGKSDCAAAPSPTAADGPSDDEPSGGGGNFPIVAFAAGTILVIALAVVLRGKTG